ncbi:hypothetical protein C8F04DRAFT_1102973 [Mycena alexandri]|uniref:Uncharacterized protein n=1 Tax=Mycena alexandri TaxID=1745969 RepID=A0AAD6SWM0_9AGAR|nr:hypothetical protein C8F04DRAFT_1102973 [Mycena alexandri]
MSLFPACFILLVAALPTVFGQDEPTTHIDGAHNSKVAITGAIIGGILLLLALIAVAVYCIERCLHRRRETKFTPLPTQSTETEPYQYLSLPKRTANKGQYYPAPSSPLASPDARSSRYGGASPARSPGAQSIRFDTYGHGPYYPGTSLASPPASPNSARVSSPLSSPMTPSFRVGADSQSTLYLSSPTTPKSATTSSSTLQDAQPRSDSRTLSRATATTFV